MLAHLTPRERFGYFALVLMFLFVAGYVGANRFRPHSPLVIEEQASPKPSNGGDAGLVVVHVAGAVKKPGVYKLATTFRVQDAIDAAGGVAASADLDKIDLAAKLLDGTQLLVPKKGEEAKGPYAAGSSGSFPRSERGSKHPTEAVDLNAATSDQLQTIPGIGPATAERILDYRKAHKRFRSVDELTAVGGIGEKKLERMRKWLHI